MMPELEQREPTVAGMIPELEQQEPTGNNDLGTGMDVDDISSNISFYDTDIDSFGVFRSYLARPPSFISAITLESLCDSPHFNVPQKLKKWWSGITKSSSAAMILEPKPADDAWQQNIITNVNDSYFQPFDNPSSYLLMKWFYSGSNAKSLAELDRLVREVLTKPDFNCADLVNFRAKRESQRVDVIKDKSIADSLFQAADGWYKINISIPVPFERVQHSSISEVPIFTVESLIYRRPLQVLSAALQDATPDEFHLQPFKLYWQHNDDPDDSERLYSELYNSDAFIEEHERIRKAYETPEREIVVVAMMLWSDSTHLANFGNASLWPIYLYTGNQSKYERCKPSAAAAHHIAYIPKVWSTIAICSFATDLT